LVFLIHTKIVFLQNTYFITLPIHHAISPLCTLNLAQLKDLWTDRWNCFLPIMFNGLSPSQLEERHLTI